MYVVVFQVVSFIEIFLLICISLLSCACDVSLPFIFLDMIILVIFGGGYKLWSSSLCMFLLSPGASPSQPCVLKHPHSVFFRYSVKEQVSVPCRTKGVHRWCMEVYVLCFQCPSGARTTPWRCLSSIPVLVPSTWGQWNFKCCLPTPRVFH
jgi:hypothetical protein